MIISNYMNSQLIKKVVQIDSEVKEINDKLDDFMTKTDFHNVMDPVVVILKRLDTERAATSEWMKRIQETSDRHEKDIKSIKEKIF